MVKVNLKQILLLCFGSASAVLLSSCVVNDARLGGYNGYGSNVYGTAGIPVGLLRTASSYWYYDPYRRSYYDVRRRAYYNHTTSNYYSSTPTRYKTKGYPSHWSGRGTFPAPRTVSRSHSQQRIYNEQRQNRNLESQRDVNRNHPRYSRSQGTRTSDAESRSRTLREQTSNTQNTSSSRNSNRSRFGTLGRQEARSTQSSAASKSNTYWGRARR